MAGIVTLVARRGKVAHLSAVGYADLQKKSRMETSTVFRLYSMTKPITSTALMMLYQEGRFQMADPVSKYLPEFAKQQVLRTPDSPLTDTVPATRAPTIQDLLRHTAGFGHGIEDGAVDKEYVKSDLFGVDVTLAEMMKRLAKIPLRAQPGSQFFYSAAPDVQARLVEVLSGMSFDEFLAQRLFQPLGMKDTAFWLGPDKSKRLATAYWMKDGKITPLDEAHGSPPQGGIVTKPSSVNSYTVNHKRKGGSFGLVGTAEDYWRFAQMILNQGELEGRRVLGSEVVNFMARDHLGQIPVGHAYNILPGCGFGLGFGIVKDPAMAGYMSSEGTLFWAGAANTHFWIDPKEDLVVVALTQDLGGAPGFEVLWPQIRTLVYSAITD